MFLLDNFNDLKYLKNSIRFKSIIFKFTKQIRAKQIMEEEKSISRQNTSLNISAKGSLGLLALGDLGLRAWREVKRNTPNKDQ